MEINTINIHLRLKSDVLAIFFQKRVNLSYEDTQLFDYQKPIRMYDKFPLLLIFVG